MSYNFTIIRINTLQWKISFRDSLDNVLRQHFVEFFFSKISYLGKCKKRPKFWEISVWEVIIWENIIGERNPYLIWKWIYSLYKNQHYTMVLIWDGSSELDAHAHAYICLRHLFRSIVVGNLTFEKKIMFLHTCVSCFELPCIIHSDMQTVDHFLNFPFSFLALYFYHFFSYLII